MTVWSLVIAHRHGHDMMLYETRALAWRALDEYVIEWWDDFCQDTPLPKRREDRIEVYFQAAGDSWGRCEYYEIGSEKVLGMPRNPRNLRKKDYS